VPNNFEAYLLDQIHAATIVVDTNGAVRFWNHYAEVLSGYSREEVLGRKGIDLLVPETEHSRVREILAALERGESWEGQARLRRKDGMLVEVQQTITPLRDRDGRIVGRASISLDVSERRRLERELRQAITTLEHVMSTSPLAIINMDADGNVTMWAGAAEEMFGWSADEVEGRPLPTVPPEELERFQRIRERHRAGERLQGVEARRLRKDGSKIDIAIFSSSLFDDEGGFAGTVAYVADITDVKRAQHRLELLNEVTAAFSRAVTVHDVASVLVQQGRNALDATEAAVSALAAHGAASGVIAASGGDGRIVAACSQVATARPGRDRARRRIVWLDGSSALSEPVAVPYRDLGDIAVVPLVAGQRTIGAAAFRFARPAPLDSERRGFLRALGDQSALAFERAELFERERTARSNAERLAIRLSQVQAVTDAALAHLALDDLLEELIERVREALGTDTATLLLLEEGGVLSVRASAGVELEDVAEVRTAVAEWIAGRLVATRRPLVVEEAASGNFPVPQLRRAGLRSVAGVPLLAGGRAIGALHVGSEQPRSFGREDVRLLELVADRVAVAIENSRHFEHERTIAETLQRSLLPNRLPDVAGVALAARYEPGGAGLKVGGDWYDALELPDGQLAVAIGDVVGHGIEAASAMGQLRNALRVHLLEGAGPAEALRGLDRLVHASESGEVTTLVCLLLDPGTRRFRYASAGHPPPLVVEPSGAARFLEAGRSLPLGASTATIYVEATDELAPGSTLLLYTDGLIERRGHSLDRGLQRLAQAAGVGTEDVEELVEHVLRELLEAGQHEDDVALVAVRPLPVPAGRIMLTLPASPEALRSLRRVLGRFLHEAGADRDEAFDVLVAAGEAAANAIEHAYGPFDARFEVEAELAGGGVEIAVRDRGHWRPSRRQGRGHGLSLMAALTDACEFERDETGTVVRMRRKLRAL
jgi:PAS domain S-box-containing protein